MIDERLPAPERTDSEPTPSAEPADGDGREPTGRPGPTGGSAPTDAPNRAAEPPPDPDDGGGSDREREPTDDGAGPDASDRDPDDPNALEYRLERLRLLRAVVTLAVVVARLIRSL